MLLDAHARRHAAECFAPASVLWFVKKTLCVPTTRYTPKRCGLRLLLIAPFHLKTLCQHERETLAGRLARYADLIMSNTPTTATIITPTYNTTTFQLSGNARLNRDPRLRRRLRCARSTGAAAALVASIVEKNNTQ